MASECIIGGVSIADKIKETRARRGWTQQQSAEYFGVSIPAYQNWENGVKPPGKHRLDVIAEWIGVPVEELGPLRPKPPASLMVEETHGLRQQLLESKDGEIDALRREIEDIRIVADYACDHFRALCEFIEPRLEFLRSADESPLNESLVMNYRLLAGQLERQLVALSRRARRAVSRDAEEWQMHRNNASSLIGSRRNTHSGESSDSKA